MHSLSNYTMVKEYVQVIPIEPVHSIILIASVYLKRPLSVTYREYVAIEHNVSTRFQIQKEQESSRLAENLPLTHTS